MLCGPRQADEVVFQGDGAKWIRNEKRKHFGRATFIIDWYHASEHFEDCGKVLFGEGSEATKKWVKKHERCILVQRELDKSTSLLRA